MDALPVLGATTFIAAALVSALAAGITNWSRNWGKITAVLAGVLLFAFLAGVALVLLAVILMPPVIALP